MKTVIIIPARYSSSRFPGKPLINLLGKPMIIWVAELCVKAVGEKNVYIATDDDRIYKVVTKRGFSAIMTSKNCLTGTDRLLEASQNITSDIYVNVQGDEPLVNPVDITKIIDAKKKYPDEIINGYTSLENNENPTSTDIPKVIFTKDKRLIYISRKDLPGFKEKKNQPKIYYKQVCIYAFNREELELFGSSGKKSALEQSEDIEILRFFDYNKKVRLIETSPGSLAVDTPADIEKVVNRLKNQKL